MRRKGTVAARFLHPKMQTGDVFCDIAPHKRTQNNGVRAVSRRKIRVACAVFLSPLEFYRANADVQRRAVKGLRYTFAEKKAALPCAMGLGQRSVCFFRANGCVPSASADVRGFQGVAPPRAAMCGRGADACRCGFGAALLTLGGYSDKIYLLRHCQRARVCVI